MDSMIKAAVHEINAIERAKAETREVIGASTLAFDSAADVYSAALTAMGVATTGIHPSAYEHVFHAYRRRQRAYGAPLIVAQDAAAAKSFAERFPDAMRIKQAW